MVLLVWISPSKLFFCWTYFIHNEFSIYLHDTKASPAYDIIHVETGMEGKFKYIEVDNVLDINFSLEVAPYFRVE